MILRITALRNDDILRKNKILATKPIRCLTLWRRKTYFVRYQAPSWIVFSSKLEAGAVLRDCFYTRNCEAVQRTSQDCIIVSVATDLSVWKSQSATSFFTIAEAILFLLQLEVCSDHAIHIERTPDDLIINTFGKELADWGLLWTLSNMFILI